MRLKNSSQFSARDTSGWVQKENAAKHRTLKKWWSFVVVFLLSLSLNAQVDVSASGGTSTASYTTLKGAFDAINAGTHTGTISISISANTTETAQAALNSSGTGSASYTSVNIKPASGTTPTISGSISTSIIKLVGADNVTIDGSNTVGGTTRDLSIINNFIGTKAITGTGPSGTTPAAEATSLVIWLAALTGDGATSNTIKNCIVRGSTRRNCYAAILSSNSSTTAGTAAAPYPGTPAANNNNTISNNSLGYAQHVIRTNVASFVESNLTITNNNIDSAFTNGIFISNITGATISGNTLNNIATSSDDLSGTIHGIQTSGVFSGCTISNNKILKVRQNSLSLFVAYSARGITLASSSNNANNIVANNFIGDVSAYGIGTSLTVHGILLTTSGTAATTTAPIWKVYHNTINLTTPSTAPNNQTSAFSVSLVANSTASLDIRNNIFANNIPSTSGNTNYWAFFNFTPTVLGFATLDKNAYYTSNAAIISNNPSQIGNLSAWQSFTGKEANGVFVQPTFTSSGDYHLSAVAGNASLNNAGTPISAVTADIDGDTRSTNYPDIGADEIIYAPKISGISPSSACAGNTVTINGADFTGATNVKLAGVNASSFSVVSTSQITAVVAGGYTSPVTDSVKVTNAYGTAASSAALTRNAPGTYISKSLSTGSTGDQVIITGTNLTGAASVTFGGVAASISITNSTQIVATVPTVSNGSVAVVITDICGNTVSAGSFTVVTANPCTTPSEQPSSFVASSTSTTALNGTFTAATGSPSGYIVVYSTSALSGTPQDGTTYTAGGSLGGGTIKQISASTSVSLTGLTGNTAYIVTIFAYNGGGCTGGPLYNTTSPLIYNFVTCSNIPTSVTATPVVVSNVNNINLSWNIPSGGSANSLSYSIDVTSDAAYSNPVSASPYTTSSLSQAVTGLNFATQYYYRIRSNNGCSSNYVTGTATTLCGGGTVLPYSQNFDAVNSPAFPGCWASEDANFDGVTWKTGFPTNATGLSSPNVLRYDANGTYVGSDATKAANDWVFSPGFNLTGGVSYSLSFSQANYSNSENLTVKYGTAQASASMTSGTLWTGAGLRNTAAQNVAVAFTPTSSGVYYFGFWVTSPAYGTATPHGGISEYVDNFKIQVTPPPPTAPSTLTFPSVGSSSVGLSWTDNSSNEDGFYVYSSTDGTNYTLQSTLAANTTTATVSNLNASTLYYFKVTAFNTGGESTSGATGSTTTTDCGGIYTTNTYVGSFFAGTVANWNTPGNWSLGHAPTSCDNVVINANNLQESGSTICYLYLNANASMHNLTITGSNTPNTAGTRQALFVYNNGYNMLISGDLTMSNDSAGNGASVNDNVLLIAGNGGNITVEGNTNIGSTGNRLASIGGASGFANIIFKGDVVLGPQALLNYGSLVYYIFDKPGNQTLTMTSTQTDGSSTYGLGNLTIGNTNTTILTLAGSGTSPASAVVGDFLLDHGSTLNIPSGQKLNRVVNGGTFTMNTGTTLKVGGSTGGVGNSNFPSKFASFSMGNSSIVEYNGTSAQDVAAAPSYWDLKVNNSAGLNLMANTLVTYDLTFVSGKVNTGSYTLTSGIYGSVSGANSSSYVNGKLAKTIGANTAYTVYQIGDASTYTPTTLNFTGNTNSGNTMTVSTTSGASSALGYARSGISTSKYLNRYYTITNNGVSGFTSFTPSFTYSLSDIIGSADNSNYKVSDSVYGGGWSILSTTNPFAITTNATLSNFASPVTADFVIGEIDPAPLPDLTGFTPTSACEGSNYVITGSNFYAITGVTIGGTNVPVFTVNSPSQITITVPVGIGNGVIAVSNATGTATTATALTTFDQPQTTVSLSSQTICSGDAITTITLGNTGNLSGTTYSWTRTGNISGGTNGTSGTTDISGTLVSTSTVSETATYAVTSNANGCAGTTVNATVTVKASPGTVSVTPSSASICQTVAQPLVGSYSAATGSSVTNSGAISVTVPDANIAGVNTILNVNNIPAGAIITGIDVGFSVTHTFVSDIAINLTAPNGKTLNLAYQEGGSGHNYTNTVISSTGSNTLPIDSTDDITGTYAADALLGVGPSAFKSNVTDFSNLYTVANGNWRLSARDYFTGDEGTITNWNITIYYTLAPTFNWTKVGGGYAGLYTDAGFTAYNGGSNSTVYVKNAPGSYTYTANLSFGGCTASSSPISVDIAGVPVATRSIASQTICSGSAITDIVLGTSNNVTGTTFSWSRDNNANITGSIGATGTGDISGTLINTTSSPITVTFTITPTGPGATACPGSDITATVTVNPTPLATASPASQNACSGTAITPITLGTTNSVSGTNYTWTRDNTSAATGIAASGNSFVSGVLTNTSGVTTVTFSITAVGPGASACAGTPATATVTVYNAASVYNVTGGGTYCSSPGTGVPVGLSNSQVGYTYQLLLNGSPVASAGGTGSALSFGNQLSAGTYTVLAQNAGCSTPMNGSATVTVITTVTPTITLVASSTTACAGTNVSFFAVSTDGGTNPTYNFLVNGISKQSGASNAYVTNTLQNGDIVSCVLSSFNTCQTSSTTNSNEITVTINAGATLAAPAAIAGTTTQCTVGASNYLKDATANGTWSSSNPSVATINTSGYVTALSNGVTVISYSITGSNGCKNSSSVVYTVAEQAAVAAITGPIKVCVGSTITLSNATSGGVWSSANNAASVNASSGVVTGTYGATNYTAIINYKVTNAAGCSKSSSYNVTVNAKPGVPTIQYAGGTANPQTGAGGGFCINKTFTVIGSPAGGAWSSSNTSVVSIGSSSGVVNTLALGTATITYTYTNANSCSNSRSVNGSVVNCPGGRGVDYVAPKQEMDFTLYPNPAKGSVAITTQFVENGGQIIVTDIFGKRVKTLALSLGTNNIDISNLSKGLYLVNVITNDGTKVKKLIIE